MTRTVTDYPVEVRNINGVVQQRIYPNAFSNDDEPKDLTSLPTGDRFFWIFNLLDPRYRTMVEEEEGDDFVEIDDMLLDELDLEELDLSWLLRRLLRQSL
ncbi:hypothetical protein V8E54_005703 [Elaphomyces granulatus]